MKQHSRRNLRHRAGFSLVEILIALVLGLSLLAAFLVVLERCRNELTANESLARVQDSARLALTLLSADIEHAGFLGFASTATPRVVRAGAVLAGATDLSQPDVDAAATAVAGLPAGAHDCGINFAVDVGRPVQASNNMYGLGMFPTDCAPTASAGGARDDADTLTLRHASLGTTAARAGRIQILSRRLAAHGDIDLFADGRAPEPLDEHHVVRDLEVRTFYVANSSVGQPGFPALRMKSLTESRGGAQFRDEELVPGVEDLQVELGIASGTGPEERVSYVTADAEAARTGRVVAVRLWLRIRAEFTEPGFRDDRALVYSDAAFTPADDAATHRRVLVERTIALRVPAHAPG
jgi:type IV pilus assembly protein PilW